MNLVTPQRKARIPSLPSPVQQERWQRLNAFDAEQLANFSGIHQAIGVDEVGRGSLIGPVVAAACVWKHPDSYINNDMLAFVNDSKQVSARVRAYLVPLIHEHCHVAIAEATMEEIATYNIIGASMRASQGAVLKLLEQHSHYSSSLVLMDGRDTIPSLPTPLQQRAVIKGDSQSALIAMASIIAKEHRDAWVKQVAIAHPHYGWERNMGYATVEHRNALLEHGLSPYHRPSYACL